MLAAALFLVEASACTMAPAGDIYLSSPNVRVDDLVDLACVARPERARVGALVLAELQPGRTRALSRDALVNLVRRRVPMLSGLQGDSAQIVLISPAARTPTRMCAFASRPLAQDAPIAENDVERRRCETPNEVLVRYDATSGLTRTLAAVEDGENLGQVAPLPSRVLPRGAVVEITIRSGPVAIQRRVRAAQDAASGERVFVASENGETFSVAFPDVAP